MRIANKKKILIKSLTKTKDASSDIVLTKVNFLTVVAEVFSLDFKERENANYVDYFLMLDVVIPSSTSVRAVAKNIDGYVFEIDGLEYFVETAKEKAGKRFLVFKVYTK